AMRSPSAVSTASTRSLPSNAATWAPASSRAPFDRCHSPTIAPTCSPSTRSSGIFPGKTEATWTPSSVSEAVTSQPMNPMPPPAAARAGPGVHRVASGTLPRVGAPGRPGPGTRQPPVPPSGCYQELLVPQLAARVQDQPVRHGINGRHAGGDALDAVRLVPAGGPDEPVLEAFLRSQVRLGQRRLAPPGTWLPGRDHHTPPHTPPPEGPPGRAPPP